MEDLTLWDPITYTEDLDGATSFHLTTPGVCSYLGGMNQPMVDTSLSLWFSNKGKQISKIQNKIESHVNAKIFLFRWIEDRLS